LVNLFIDILYLFQITLKVIEFILLLLPNFVHLNMLREIAM